MSTIKQLLEIKRVKKAQQPVFLRRNFKKNKRSRVTGEWRAPRGLHNKLRRRRRGIGQWVMPGYRMPKAVRGMTREGLFSIVIENMEQLKSVKAETHSLILKASIGKKRRIEIIKEALRQKFMIVNVKDPILWIKNVEEQIAQRKNVRKEKEKKQETKPEEKKEEESKEKKAEKEETKTAEDISKEQRKEQEKILTKKE